MILQYDITGIEWIMGLPLLFGLSLVFNLIKGKSTSSFLIWMLVVDTFIVYAGLLDVSSLYIIIILNIISIYIQFNGKSGGD